MFQKSSPIAADPLRVFDALTEIAAIPRWIPIIRSAQILSPGPLRVGSRFTQEAAAAFYRFPIDGVVRQYSRPHHFAYEYERGVMAGYWSYTILATDHGAILESRIDFRASRLLRPLLSEIVSGNLDRFAGWAGSADAMV